MHDFTHQQPDHAPSVEFRNETNRVRLYYFEKP